MERVQENLGALQVKLTADDLAEIGALRNYVKNRYYTQVNPAP
ncbi:hypothetical protein [Paenibacillus sp. GbtcB18]|nr:hypothetical protein [Paenibacillus sp. GbtcB18]